MTQPHDSRIGVTGAKQFGRASDRATRPSVAGQFGWLSIGNLAATALQALIIMLLARWTAPDDFGLISIVASVIVIAQSITDLGIPVFVTRQRAADPQDSDVTQALRINSATSFSMGLVVSLGILLAGVVFNPILFQLLPLGLWAAVERNADVWLGIFVADGKAQLSCALLTARRLGAIVAFLLLSATVIPIPLAYSIALTVMSVAANWSSRKLISGHLASRFGSRATWEILKSARSYWINSMAAQIRNADTIVVGLLGGSVAAAYYAAAARTTGPLRILPSSLSSVLIPAAARSATNVWPLVRKPILLVTGTITLIYCAIIVAAPFAVPLLLGSNYQPAVLPLQIVVGGLVFGALASILGGLLQGMGYARRTAQASVASTTTCLVSIAAFAPAYGAIGAACGLAASFALQAAVLALYLTRVNRQDA